MVLIINTAIKHKNFIKSSFFERELQRYDYFSNDLYNILWPYNDSLDKMMINLIEKYYSLNNRWHIIDEFNNDITYKNKVFDYVNKRVHRKNNINFLGIDESRWHWYYYLTKQDPATEEPLNIYELNKYFIINYVMNGYKYYLEDYRDFINNIQH
jgi:hypothetical protein